MSRHVYFAGKNHFGLKPNNMMVPLHYDIDSVTRTPRRIPVYFEIYDRFLAKPLRHQSIKQMECTSDSCYILTTELSQVFYMGEKGHRDKELLHMISPQSRGETLSNHIVHLAALDHCCVSLIGTARKSAFYYSSILNQIWFTGVNMIDHSAIIPDLTQVQLPDELHSKEIVKMNGTESSMFFLTNDGCLYALGEFSAFVERTISRLKIPGIMGDDNSSAFVTDVQSGDGHTLVLLSNGQCYGIGSSSYGQLTSEGTKRVLTLCDVPGKIQWIRACSQHSFFGTEDGCVYASGYNADHRLVIDNTRYSVTVPQKLDFPTRQVKHLFGYVSTMIIDKNNEVYTTGANGGGDCGHSTSEPIFTTSLLRQPRDMIQQIARADFIIDFASGIYFRFLYLKPDPKNARTFAEKLLSVQRRQLLLDVDIFTEQ